MLVRFALAALLAIVPAAAVAARTVYVPDDFSTIQLAIWRSDTGDTVVVRPGTYRENLDFWGRDLVVRSEEGPGVTVIDGGQAAACVTFQSGETRACELRGFTITNGTGGAPGGVLKNGGGVLCDRSCPSIIDNVITGNRAYRGGGIHCGGDELTGLIRGNVICDNYAESWGGGGIDCSFYKGIITENIITGNRTDGVGGGIHCACCPQMIYRNIIVGNSAYRGGAISLDNTDAALVTCNIIRGNSAVDHGGALCLFGDAIASVTNCTIVLNKADYMAGFLSCDANSACKVTNCIVRGNRAPSGFGIFLSGGYSPSRLAISRSNLEGGQASIFGLSGSSIDWGAGMIDVDPLFAEPNLCDFHLTHGSPCRDSGDNGSVPACALDFEGDPRIADGAVDMGADEFHPHLYRIGAITPGSTISIRAVGPPGAPSLFLCGSGLLSPPRPTPWGELHLRPPILRKPSGLFPASGVLKRPFTIPGAVPAGTSLYTQMLAGSSLTNLLVLAVE